MNRLVPSKVLKKIFHCFRITRKKEGSLNGEESKNLQKFLSRFDFMANLDQQKELTHLEIGPLNRPLLRGENVKYFDLEGTLDLKSKAIKEGLDPNTVPEIDFHNNEGDLAVVNQKFDSVVSSHVIEHQPDLIRHLQNVSSLLKSNSGLYSLVIPDKRYCFDALIPESKITDIIEAFDNKSTKPSFWKVVEHRALTTHNDPVLHWSGIHGNLNTDLKKRWDAAVNEFENSEGKYIDVHCWQFTPVSFAGIIKGLRELGYIDFKVEEIFDTPRDDLEFCVTLRKV
jgi:hypothetical protein